MSPIERCKNCGEPIPEVVREVEKKVEVGDAVAWLRALRWISLVAVTAIAAGTGSCIALRHYESQEMEKILSDPKVKVEIRELPRGIEKVYTRDPR